ncbi:cytochrome P450 [Amycolatopsis methanolica]|uniref:Cytochrome P450 n=1 Tax=Amycolatopsis methanolica 239 TaxID=1068978 RepID=A0A076MRK9_AMYME|nr:cytochrome P450 [Amycolatopsis methanolica]AIJ23294.1 cytochrome P450 [Amycolatopsis methanolica 239]
MTTTPKAAADEELRTDFDIHDPANADNVYERYAELRAKCPVAHSSAYGGHWVATRYDDIHEIVRNPEVFSSECVNIPPTIGQDGPMIPLEVDPPDHTTYRQLLTPLFSPTRMAAIEPDVRRIVVELLDGMAGKEKCDFITDFAKPLPTKVFLTLMGWPMSDTAKFHEWTDTIVLGKPGASEEEATAVRMAAAMEVYAYFAEMLDDRMADPSSGPDDVTSVLVNGKFGDRPLTQFEILNTLFVMMIGGLHTVQGQLAHSVIYFAEHPDRRRQLVDDPDLVPSAVEEMLRYESAVSPARVVKQDTELGGVRLTAGDRILIPLGAANRDPEKFDNPDEVDLTREPNPHLAFGGGRHRCLGSHLARIELRVAFEELHRRFPDYRLDPADPPQRHLSQVKGVERLPLVLGQSV